MSVEISVREAAQDLPALVSRAHEGEHVGLTLDGAVAAVLVSPEEARLLEALEDNEDAQVALERLKDLEEGRASTISFEELREQIL